MTSRETQGVNSALRILPSVDELLRTPAAQAAAIDLGVEQVARLSREVLSGLRKVLGKEPRGASRDDLLMAASSRIEARHLTERLSGTNRVINATGVVLHTNLGRAPLSDAARLAAADAAGRYCTLEYDVENGKRGHRGRRAEQLVRQLTGAEDALIVNNCAAAAFFVLSVFAEGGEVIISRGELVEIGGDFRVPDVLAQSGAALREVGTTNRTKVVDYERAIGSSTRAILRVHPSNYRIVGFTARPRVDELAELARRHKLLLYEDIGSGALIDLAGAGISDEPLVKSSLKQGAAIVTFSGDKLVGGPQSGIIAGKKKLIDQLRRHPLYRILRVDKMTYAALEATLGAYARGLAETEIPVQRMLRVSGRELEDRAADLASFLALELGGEPGLSIEIAAGQSAVGGGSAPGVELPAALVAIAGRSRLLAEMSRRLRIGQPSVIARVADGRLLIDLRTVFDDQLEELRKALVIAAKLGPV